MLEDQVSSLPVVCSRLAATGTSGKVMGSSYIPLFAVTGCASWRHCSGDCNNDPSVVKLYILCSCLQVSIFQLYYMHARSFVRSV